MVRSEAHAGGKASMQGLGELQMTFKVQPQKKNTEERDVEHGKECAIETKATHSHGHSRLQRRELRLLVGVRLRRLRLGLRPRGDRHVRQQVRAIGHGRGDVQ